MASSSDVAFGDFSAGSRHHPAAFVLALGFKVKNAGLLEFFEGRIPEFQVKYLALAGQEIVFDVEAQHGFKMAAKDCRRDQLGHFGGFIAAVLDLVQRCVAQLLPLGVLFLRAALVPPRGVRVEVPAVKVDGRFRAFQLCAFVTSGDQRADVDSGLLFKMHEAHDHVGHLHAGVVDVVLHVDFLTGSAKETDEGVSENGIAKVADVRGLVGIDAGVLDQCMDQPCGGAVGAQARAATARTPAPRSRRALM